MVGKQRRIKEKFQEGRQLPPIIPKTDNQKLAMMALYDPSISLTILSAPAGAGKSWITGSVASDLFLQHKLEQIIVARPYIQTGRTSGFKPGSTLEKLYPYVRNILDPIEQRLGKGAFENALKDGQRGAIQVQEVESIRGRSFDSSSFLCLDEAQQTLPEEMESIVTRVGEHCKLVVCGDLEQSDIKQKSGMEWLIDFVDRHNIKGVAQVNFTIDDCVRSGFVKNVLKGLHQDKLNGETPKDFK